MTVSGRRPVIVGVGQHTQRTNDGEPVLEPAVLIAEAARRALDDAGKQLHRVGSVRLLQSRSAVGYRNAPLLAAEFAGVRADEYLIVEGGGESPGAALLAAADAISSGAHDSVLLLAGEAWNSHMRARRSGTSMPLTQQASDVSPPAKQGSMIEFVHPAERELGIERPIQEYPLFEQSLRAARGRSVVDHQEHLGRFLARMSAAAQKNPYAWDRSVHSAEEIATPSASNRMVGSPYTKLMVSNEQVDMAAAMLVTSAEWADAHGVARDRWVFPLAAARGEAPLISNRFALHESVLVRAVGGEVQRLGGRPCTDAAHIDLYSCFPSAVQIQAAELRLDDSKPLSVTGGMPFSGGPWFGYSMHAFAAVVEALRSEPGSLGLVGANGGAMSKLVLTLLSTQPTEFFRHCSAQKSIDAAPRREVAIHYRGAATVESATVMHGRGGVPEQGIVAALLPDGRRAWGIVRDSSQVAAMLHEDVLGAPVDLNADGTAVISS